MLTENLLHDESTAAHCMVRLCFWEFCHAHDTTFFERILSGFPSERYALFADSLTMSVLAVQLELGTFGKKRS